MAALDVVTVPYDSGRRGYRMGAGPQALLKSGLVQKLRSAGHEVELVPVEAAASSTDAVTVAFDLAARIARVVRASHSAGRFPITVCGNCFGSIGSLTGLSAANAALIWLDAHGDLNTPETSPSGFLDGMAAAAAVGWCHTEHTAGLDGFTPISESDLLLIGTRDLDDAEADLMRGSAVRSVTPAALDTLDGALSTFAGRAMYLHLDLDVLDPVKVGPANTYAAEGGLGADDVARVIDGIAKHGRLAGMTLSSYDPAVDATGAVARAATDLITRAVSRLA